MARIIVVDDSPALAALTAAVLRRAGHAVETADDGETAVAILTGAGTPRFDLVFLDLRMPGMDGLDVLAALRSDPGARGVPVVVYSAEDDARTREAAHRLGARDYLLKTRTSFEDLAAAAARHATPSPGRLAAAA